MRQKILIYQEAWGCGGIEAFVMGLLRDLDAKEFDVELYSSYEWDSGYDDELRALGVTRNTIIQGRMPGHIRRFLRGTCAWSKRLRAGDVDVVHVNAMNGVTLVYVAIAKRRGVPVRVAHSHNTSFAGGARWVKAAAHNAARMLWGGAATQRLACSQAAGRYLFGRKRYIFVPNGVDVNRFRFDASARERIRSNLGVDRGTFLFGSVGRLSYQKNPLFVVEVLAEAVRGGADAHLLLVGNGELEDEVLSRVTALGLTDKFTHLSSVGNPEDFYCALDAFVLPSLFEGFSYALLEAQCSGLPCVVSEAIQDEVCLTNLVSRTKLDSGAAAWCNLLLEQEGETTDREAYAVRVGKTGFSVAACSEAVRNAWK